jgi:hypothetical protein
VSATGTTADVQPATGALATTATAAGAAAVARAATGTVTVTATATGTTATAVAVDGALAVTAGRVAAGRVVLPVAGTLAVSVTLTGATGTSLRGDLPVSAVLAGQGAVSGNLAGAVAATVTAAGAASLSADRAGTLPVTAALIGAAGVTRPVAGDLAVTATATGAVASSNVAGALAVTAAVTGIGEVPRSAGGDLAATAGATGAVAVDRAVVGQLSVTTVTAGAATVTTAAGGTGQLDVAVTVVGAVTVTGAGATGQLAVTGTVAGTAAVTMLVVGQLTVAASRVGAVAGAVTPPVVITPPYDPGTAADLREAPGYDPLAGTLTVTGTTAGSPTRVEVSVDGAPGQMVSGINPWTTVVDVSTWTVGAHTLTATSFDLADAVVAVSETTVWYNPSGIYAAATVAGQHLVPATFGSTAGPPSSAAGVLPVTASPTGVAAVARPVTGSLAGTVARTAAAEAVGPYEPPTFTHGDQLTPTNIGYTPWGEELTTTVEEDVLIETPDTTIRNTRFMGVVVIRANNVVFERCHFYKMVSNFEDQEYHFEIYDSEIGPPTGWTITGYDLESSVQGAIGRYNWLARRCYIHDVDEGPRMQRSCDLVECFVDRLHRPTTNEHCDGAQTYGANGGVSGGSGLSIVRCRFNARLYDPGRNPIGELGSSCYQNGDGTRDMACDVTDNLFEGATIGVRAYDAFVDSGLVYTITGNKFVRDSFQEGPATTANTDPSNLTWSNNTWSDNGEVIPAP